MIWRCVICFVFVGLTLKSLLSHINSAHSRSPDFRVVCGIDGCSKEYRVYNSLWYHIRRNHREHLESGSSTSRRERTATATSSREASSSVSRNVWAYRPATVENREHQTEDNRVQPCPHSVSPQHFGAFDSTASLYSGFDDGTCISPSLPALSHTVDGTLNKTSNILDVPCPAEVVASASCQSKVILLFPSVLNYIQLSPIINICVYVLAYQNKSYLDCYKMLFYDSVFYTLNFLFLKDDTGRDTLTRQATAIMLTAREKHHLSQVCLHTTLHL